MGVLKSIGSAISNSARAIFRKKKTMTDDPLDLIGEGSGDAEATPETIPDPPAVAGEGTVEAEASAEVVTAEPAAPPPPPPPAPKVPVAPVAPKAPVVAPKTAAAPAAQAKHEGTFAERFCAVERAIKDVNVDTIVERVKPIINQVIGDSVGEVATDAVTEIVKLQLDAQLKPLREKMDKCCGDLDAFFRFFGWDREKQKASC